jgi:hypothetical protein
MEKGSKTIALCLCLALGTFSCGKDESPNPAPAQPVPTKVQLEDEIRKIQAQFEAIGLYIVSADARGAPSELLWHWDGGRPDTSRISRFESLLEEFRDLCERAAQAATSEPIRAKLRAKAALMKRTLAEGLTDRLKA